jgi:hypothetical protein
MPCDLGGKDLDVWLYDGCFYEELCMLYETLNAIAKTWLHRQLSVLFLTASCTARKRRDVVASFPPPKGYTTGKR